jgi:predicted transcriptional regulator
MTTHDNGGASSEGGPRLNSSPSSNKPTNTSKRCSAQLQSGRNPAGFKDSGGGTTSFEAAVAIAHSVGHIQAQVLDVLKDGPATPEEISDRIGRHFTSVRPRLSELLQKGLVADTGQRGKGALGGKVRIWRLSTHQEIEAFQAVQAEAQD